MKKRSIFGVIIYILILVVLLSWMLGLFDLNTGDVTYSEIVELFEKEQVKSFTVQRKQIRLELHEPYNGKTTLVTTMADAESFRREMWPTLQAQTQSGTLESYDFMPEKQTGPFDLTT